MTTGAKMEAAISEQVYSAVTSVLHSAPNPAQEAKVSYMDARLLGIGFARAKSSRTAKRRLAAWERGDLRVTASRQPTYDSWFANFQVHRGQRRLACDTQPETIAQFVEAL